MTLYVKLGQNFNVQIRFKETKFFSSKLVKGVIICMHPS